MNKTFLYNINESEIMENYTFEKYMYRLVYDRKKENKEENLIQLEIYNPFNHRKAYCTTHVKIKPSEWDNRRKIVINREGYEQINAFLYRFKCQAEMIEMDYRLRGVRVTITMLKYDIRSKRKVKTGNNNFYDFIENYINEPSERKKSTIDNLWGTLKSLKGYKPSLSFDQIDNTFLNGYEKHLLEKGISVNTLVKQMTNLKLFINQAVIAKYLKEEENPFRYYKPKSRETKHRALTSDDITKIEKLDPKDKHMRKIKDAFLFCCYTGFRFSDFVSLTNGDFSIDKDGNHWIRKKSVKTNIQSSIPISKLFNGKTCDIMEKYNWDIRKLNKIGTNGGCNKGLKEIYRECGLKLDFSLSWHVSRHTFATTLIESGMPINVVSKMLGHTSVKMSETYCDTTDKAIMTAIEQNCG